jgi:hypothetical protein
MNIVAGQPLQEPRPPTSIHVQDLFIYFKKKKREIKWVFLVIFDSIPIRAYALSPN